MNALVTTLLITLTFGSVLLASEETDFLIVEYYDVSGATPREIRQELDQRGPLDEDGSRHDGYTRWHIRWAYQLEPNGDGCRLRSFETKLKVTMTLPRWDGLQDASTRLAEQWEKYIAALRLHEDGHSDIAVAAAEAIERKTVGRRSTTDCQSLADDVNATAEAVLAEYRRQQLEYDQETKHGKTQGATFP